MKRLPHPHASPPSLRCLVVTGPTATGKTHLAVALARHFDGEIISADSRQVYRGMDLGTGKDLDEYGQGVDRVPVHLLDVVEPTESYHLYRFVREAREALLDITARGRLPVIAGGTPLYVNALLDGYELEGGDPDSGLRNDWEQRSDDELLAELARRAPDIHARTDTTQRRRIIRALEIAATREDAPTEPEFPPLNTLILAPYFPRPVVHERIARRLDERITEGMLDEVRLLHENGCSWERLDWFGLEYRYAARHLQGELTLDEFREQLLARIRRFCKGQDGWFRKMEREGKVIHWLPEGDLAQAVELARLFLADAPLPLPVMRLNDTLYGPRTN